MMSDSLLVHMILREHECGSFPEHQNWKSDGLGFLDARTEGSWEDARSVHYMIQCDKCRPEGLHAD